MPAEGIAEGFRRAVLSFHDTATTEIYTLSLHDALPIYGASRGPAIRSTSTKSPSESSQRSRLTGTCGPGRRSEEHTSELQSHSDLVCRLLLEKKKYNMCHKVRRRRARRA